MKPTHAEVPQAALLIGVSESTLYRWWRTCPPHPALQPRLSAHGRLLWNLDGIKAYKRAQKRGQI